MSFLIDPPLLAATGAAVAATTPDPRRRRRMRAAVLGVFVGTSVSLYLNLGWTRPIWRLCRAESGRDWMLNSGVTRFEHRRPRPWVHALAAALFATYPLWYDLGERWGRRLSVPSAAGPTPGETTAGG